METATTTIPNGTFTIQSPTGEHRTFRIRTQKETANFAPGKRVLAILNGPDNSNDYLGFAFVNDTGISLWGSRQSSCKTKPNIWKQYCDIVWSMATEGAESRYAKKGATLLIEKKCLICNRKLTHPDSLKSGIGPECIKHV